MALMGQRGGGVRAPRKVRRCAWGSAPSAAGCEASSVSGMAAQATPPVGEQVGDVESDEATCSEAPGGHPLGPLVSGAGDIVTLVTEPATSDSIRLGSGCGSLDPCRIRWRTRRSGVEDHHCGGGSPLFALLPQF